MLETKANVYFCSWYMPDQQEGHTRLTCALCAASARDIIRKIAPGCKYLRVDRVPELAVYYDPRTGTLEITDRV